MNRQQRRAMKKTVGSDAQEKMSTQVAQFGKLPQACSACQKEFDKKGNIIKKTAFENSKIMYIQEYSFKYY